MVISLSKLFCQPFNDCVKELVLAHQLFPYVHIIPPKIISRNYFVSIPQNNKTERYIPSDSDMKKLLEYMVEKEIEMLT